MIQRLLVITSVTVVVLQCIKYHLPLTLGDQNKITSCIRWLINFQDLVGLVPCLYRHTSAIVVLFRVPKDL